jgi:hypothetical protein
MKNLLDIITELLDLNCSYYVQIDPLAELVNYKVFLGTEFHSWVNSSPIQNTLVITD